MEGSNPKLGVTEAVKKYQSDFTRLASTVFKVCNNEFYLPATAYQKVLDKYLTTSLSYRSFPYHIEREDIEQELNLIWVKLLDQFYTNKPQCSLRQYLIRCSIWALRDWIDREVTWMQESMDFAPVQNDGYEQIQTDIEFVLLSDGSSIFDALSASERYLLFTIYMGDRTLQEFCDAVAKHPATLRKEAKRIVDKLLNERTSAV